jgi:DNA-binding transcriptional MerR regulator
VRPIPNKLFFKIREVAKIAGVEAYVLRFWETEFPSLAPEKSKAGHRVYRRKDVETVLKIRELLYDRKYTIPGARRELERGRRPDLAADRARALTEVRDELREILTLLNRKPRVAKSDR